jgi:hypothetical protein
MNTAQKALSATDAGAKRRQTKRLDEIALSLVLIMTGALWLAPEATVPEGSWLTGLGLILLGLNAVRRVQGIRVSGFGVVVGFIALAAGIGHIIGQELPFVPILLIVLGVGLVIRAAAGPKRTTDMPDAS